MPNVLYRAIRGGALLLVLQALPAAAAPAESPADVVITGWTVTEGVPPEVRAIVRDKVGYLWLGTAGGLLRFDGMRFVAAEELFEEIVLGNPISSLLLGRKGDLWIGFGPRGGVGRLSFDGLEVR